MRKRFLTSMVAFIMSVVFISLNYGQVGVHTAPAPLYTLKAWQIADGDAKEYLWSIEGEPNQGYTGTLYKSLASPALRERIGRFPAGTKLTWNFIGAGLPDALPHEDFKDFRTFCSSKHVDFVSLVQAF